MIMPIPSDTTAGCVLSSRHGVSGWSTAQEVIVFCFCGMKKKEMLMLQEIVGERKWRMADGRKSGSLVQESRNWHQASNGEVTRGPVARRDSRSLPARILWEIFRKLGSR